MPNSKPTNKQDKTLCHTPTPGKKPTAIPSWKFNAVRDAILKIVPSTEPGIAAKDLADLVAQVLSAEVKTELGSVTWHTTTVKLQMEVSGELQRVAGISPQHLIRV